MTPVDDIDWQYNNLSRSHPRSQKYRTPIVAYAEIIETSRTSTKLFLPFFKLFTENFTFAEQ